MRGEEQKTTAVYTGPRSEASVIRLRGWERYADLAFAVAGASAVYAGHPLQRCFRDIHTANQHIAFAGQSFSAHGHALLH